MRRRARKRRIELSPNEIFLFFTSVPQAARSVFFLGGGGKGEPTGVPKPNRVRPKKAGKSTVMT